VRAIRPRLHSHPEKKKKWKKKKKKTYGQSANNRKKKSASYCVYEDEKEKNLKEKDPGEKKKDNKRVLARKGGEADRGEKAKEARRNDIKELGGTCQEFEGGGKRKGYGQGIMPRIRKGPGKKKGSGGREKKPGVWITGPKRANPGLSILQNLVSGSRTGSSEAGGRQSSSPPRRKARGGREKRLRGTIQKSRKRAR